jgi:uncharacterized membrane-anchored protein
MIMKSFKLTLAAIALATGLATTAQAGSLTAYAGQTIDLGAVNGVAYYTVEKEGYRIVATLADTNSNAVRFETVLVPGQTVVLSSPAARGETPERIEISRNDEGVQVQRVPVTN